LNAGFPLSQNPVNRWEIKDVDTAREFAEEQLIKPVQFAQTDFVKDITRQGREQVPVSLQEMYNI
jgi:hypothetical protein